jgi:hypothetical protein
MSHTEGKTRLSHEPSPLEVAVRDRSWDWLLELRRRLKVDLLVVDAQHEPLLPRGLAEQPVSLLSLIEERDGALPAAIDAAVRTRAPQVIEVSDLQIVCVALGTDRLGGGALLAARIAPRRPGSVSSRAQLELVASWLSAAAEAHLAGQPTFSSSGIGRVGPLARLLGQGSESDRELVRLFGEAVAVWHDIEACGYVETSTGVFARDVALPGTRRGDWPATIPSAGLPESGELVQLPHGHLGRFGLPVDRDVYVRRFTAAAGRSWLLVFTGAINGYDLQRLSAYVGLLELALSRSVSEVTTAVALEMNGRLAEAGGSRETRARRAIEALRTAVGAASAQVTISGQDGVVLTRAESPPMTAEATDRAFVRLVLVKESEPHYTTTVSLNRRESLQFTPRDYAAVSVAADMFATWARAGMGGSEKRERRAMTRGFQEILERSAREALERGRPVAIVVLVVRDAASLPGSTQRWVSGIRGQLRASDIAGMLAEGEIGLLMHDTGLEQARHIGERLRAVAGTSDREAILIGTSSRSPGQGPVNGIVHDARADALAGTRRPGTTGSPYGVNR